jgi:hypothetical protein
MSKLVHGTSALGIQLFYKAIPGAAEGLSKAG